MIAIKGDWFYLSCRRHGWFLLTNQMVADEKFTSHCFLLFQSSAGDRFWFVVEKSIVWYSRLDSKNSYPKSDVFFLSNWTVPGKWYSILGQNSLISIPYPRLNCSKTLPFTTAHTYMADIWEYPPRPGWFPRKTGSWWCNSHAWESVL